MSWQRYQNELIVLGALLIMLGGYMYKHSHVSAQAQQANQVQQSINEVKEVVALKRVWADKKIGKKVDALQQMASGSKIKWAKQKQKLEATYTGLNAQELNRLTTKILNLPVAIEQLDINKNGLLYNVEFKCKW